MLWWHLVRAVVVSAILVGLAVVPAAAQSDRDRDRDRHRDRDPVYLALGDSVPFGFNPLLDPKNPANFVGYPEVLARLLDLQLTNAACPGEASGGFISLGGVDNLCRPYRAHFLLHVTYTTSQLDFAVSFLERQPRTRLVTLTLGANDLFVLENQCGGNAACIQAGLPALLNTLSANLNTIYGRIRNQADYRHTLVGLTYYATNYSDPVGVAVIQAINARVAQATLAAHGRVADGFDAFRLIAQVFGGDSCKAGVLLSRRRSSRGSLCITRGNGSFAALRRTRTLGRTRPVRRTLGCSG